MGKLYRKSLTNNQVSAIVVSVAMLLCTFENRMYISLRNYLRIKNCLKPELHLDIRKNLVLTNIKKQNVTVTDAEHNERMNVYIKIDKEWAKKARESIKYYGLFNIIAEKQHKLKTHLFLKCNIIDIE